MKEETKKLLNKIIESMRPDGNFTEQEKDDFEDFCRKTETIEHDLKNGGFVPDIHGKPCKHGDKIREVDGEFREGLLTWDDYSRCFCFEWENINEPLGEMGFEKVE